jgi:carbonic anhydrase
MSVIDELVSANRAATEGGEIRGLGLPGAPGRAVAIVTCMDCRIDLERALGLGIGEAHVVRNAGGVVSDDVIRSLALSQRKLGTREVMLIHHDKCGVATVTDDEFRAELLADTGIAPPFAIDTFTDAEADVRQSIHRVRRSPFLPHTDGVRGFVYDVDTGALREVFADPLEAEAAAVAGGADGPGPGANDPGEEIV